MKQIIALFVFALALTACEPAEETEARPPTREELSTQSDNLAMAMLSWEMQTPAEREGICARATVSGQLGTQQAWAAKQGGAAGEYGPAASWLLDTCETEGY
jgi:hypothetical protein